MALIDSIQITLVVLKLGMSTLELTDCVSVLVCVRKALSIIEERTWSSMIMDIEVSSRHGFHGFHTNNSRCIKIGYVHIRIDR